MDTMQSNFVNKSVLFVKIIGLILICSNVIVLIGWLSHISALTRILSFVAPIPINTAFCFILSGFALLLSQNKNTGFIAYTIIAITSIIIMLISGMTLFEYIQATYHPINDSLNREIQYPIHMAFITALNFIFVAFTFLLINRISGLLIQIFPFLIFFIGLFAFYNYMLEVNMHYSIAAYTTMSVFSAALFMLLGLALLLLKPSSGFFDILLKNSSGGYYARRILPGVLFAPMIISYLENKLEVNNLIDPSFGDSITAAGTFIILGIAVSIITRKMDSEEKKLLTAETKIIQDDIVFREFADNIDIVFYKTSPDLSKILYVSPAYEKIWGRSIESLYANPQQWFESILPDDQKNISDEYVDRLIKGDVSASTEYSIKRPDGEIRNILARGFNLRDENSNRFCIIGIAIDITNVKQEKKYLHTREDIIVVTENEKTINAASPKILKIVCQMFKWDLGEIWLIDEETNKLRFINNWHIESEKINQYNKISREHTFKLGEGLPGKIWQERGCVWIPDYSKRREFNRSFSAEKAGLNCAFGMPIIFQDHIYGIMEFFSYKIHTPDEAMLSQMSSIGKLMGEFTHRSYTNDEMKSLSCQDILTGLLNRSALEENIDGLISNKKYEIIAIIIVDIDKFKLVNEALGQDKGDLLIISAAKRLEEITNPDTTYLARFGADKFVLCYFEIQNAQDVVDYVHQIEREFNKPFKIDERDIFLTVSTGITIYPQDACDAITLIANADQALTSAKNGGGNKSIFFTKELPEIALEKLTMHIDLHQAIIKNQFILYYQPQVNLKSGEICGAEALIRWQHPTKGIISPADFISYSEQTGFIISLNEHVMRMVFQQVKSGWAGPPISVNISAQQFKDKYHLVEYIESLMNEFSVNPKHIEFEITESLLMENTQHNIAILGALRQMGFQFAIDDFGTGFSSFSYLYRIPAHKIKIDKSFITGLPGNQANAEIVKSMIAMLHSLGKVVVAEGAEIDAEIEYLKKENCDIVQGYFYYKPMLIDDFIALIV